MVAAAKTNLKAAGEKRRVCRVVADAGYWSVDKMRRAMPATSPRPSISWTIPRVA
jgi:hypothetical protein